jgi:hypothetical protein
MASVIIATAIFLELKMYNVVIATTTCSKYCRTRVESIKKTWYTTGCFKNINFLHLFFTGKETNYGDVITLNCNDNYEFLTEKTYYMLKYCYDNYKFDYLIKTNDDSFFDYKKFADLNFYNYDYGGYCCTNTEIDTLQRTDFAQGGFYFLSRESVEYILNAKEELSLLKNSNSSIEDQHIGKIMAQKHNLKFLKLNNLPKIDIPFHICRDGIAFHPVHYTLMKTLKENCNNFLKQITILKLKFFLSDYK